MDWTTFPAFALHNYRSAYRLQIPSSYTNNQAELLYKSCDLALRAPSQVLARRKAYDLKLYKRRQAQQASNSRSQLNGVSKSRSTKSKEKRKKEPDSTKPERANTRLALREPPSPTSNSHSNPANSNADAASNPPESVVSTSRKSPTVETEEQNHAQEPDQPQDQQVLSIPATLNQHNPLSTVLGSTPANSLQTSIRKHFNAQHLNEAETIARFTYVVRQQGSDVQPRQASVRQRLAGQQLPQTIAENIALVAERAARNPIAASAIVTATNAKGEKTDAGTAQGVEKTSEKEKNKSNAHSLTVSRTLGGQHVSVEGARGDGHGSIMGTTSCGREVRLVDGGGTGSFRLRFRP